MPITNPYAKKKTGPSISKPTLQKNASAGSINNVSVKAGSETPLRASHVKSSDSMIQSNALPIAKPAIATGLPRNPTAAIISPVQSAAIREALTVNLSAPKSIKKSSKKSFRSQLKNEIQELKRKKKIEMHRKVMEKRLKEQEAEKKRREEECARLRIENEKRKAEERQRKEEERERLRAEKEKQREAKAAERLAREVEKERQSQERERIAMERRLQQDMAYHKRFMESQQRQFFNPHHMNMPATNSAAFHLNPINGPMIPNYYHQVVNRFPSSNASLQRTINSDTNSQPMMSVSNALHQISNLPGEPIFSPTLKNKFVEDQTSSVLGNAFLPQPLSAPFLSAPAQVLSVTPSPTMSQNPPSALIPRHHPYPFALRPNYWQSPPPPKRQRAKPSPLDQILSLNVLEEPSPFAADFELLLENIWIAKERGGKFGVSVHVQCRKSALLDPDVWQNLHAQREITREKTGDNVTSEIIPVKEQLGKCFKPDGEVKVESSQLAVTCTPDAVATAEAEMDTVPEDELNRATIDVQSLGTKACVQSSQSDMEQDINDPLTIASTVVPKNALCNPRETDKSLICGETKKEVAGARKSGIGGVAVASEFMKDPAISQTKESLSKVDKSVDHPTTIASSSQLHSICAGQDASARQLSEVRAELKVDQLNHPASPTTRSDSKPYENLNAVNLSVSDSDREQRSNCNLYSNATNRVVDIKESVAPPVVNELGTAQNSVQGNAKPKETLIKSSAHATLSKPKKQRRKRLSFYAMIVADATKQNDMALESDPKRRLQPGDIILEINGTTTTGLSYGAATQLFASCTVQKFENTTSGKETNELKSKGELIKFSLVVARKKEKPEPVKLPVATSPKKPVEASDPKDCPCPNKVTFDQKTIVTRTGDFTGDELVALANFFSKTLTHSDRSLGLEVTDDIFQQCLTSGNFESRDQVGIHEKLKQIEESIEKTSAVDASAYWKEDWEEKCLDIKIPDVLKLTFMSLAQVSTVRALPRPLRGCRCGAVDHEYVNSEKCVLYYSLRKASGQLENISKQPNKLQKKLKDLSALQNAFKDRLVKAKEEQENEILEANFVDEMEKFQAKERKQAIFSPNFITMVICAVIELGTSFDKRMGRRTRITIDKDETNPLKDDENQDLDDLPLSILGKCETEHHLLGGTKKVEMGGNNTSLIFHPLFLAKILDYISRTWGHLYREPSHPEYSWRWEVHHGQTSETMAAQEKLRNPRVPGSLTFENIRFALHKTMMERLEMLPYQSPSKFHDDDEEDTKKKLWATDMLKLSILVSSRHTGLLDELKALEQLGIIEMSKFGGAVLTEDWYTKVDPLILNEMESNWSFERDTNNKFLIPSKVKRDLANYWVKVDSAWALNEDLSEIVFTDEEWNSWRRCFEDEIEKMENYEDGIGKFGI